MPPCEALPTHFVPCVALPTPIGVTQGHVGSASHKDHSE
jgi:hypothetical protein